MKDIPVYIACGVNKAGKFLYRLFDFTHIQILRALAALRKKTKGKAIKNIMANPPAARAVRQKADPFASYPIERVRAIASIPGDTAKWIYDDDARTDDFHDAVGRAIVKVIKDWDAKCHDGETFHL